MTQQQKKDLVKFLVGGLAALAISKIESTINKKANDYFGTDKEQEN